MTRGFLFFVLVCFFYSFWLIDGAYCKIICFSPVRQLFQTDPGSLKKAVSLTLTHHLADIVAGLRPPSSSRYGIYWGPIQISPIDSQEMSQNEISALNVYFSGKQNLFKQEEKMSSLKSCFSGFGSICSNKKKLTFSDNPFSPDIQLRLSVQKIAFDENHQEVEAMIFSFLGSSSSSKQQYPKSTLVQSYLQSITFFFLTQENVLETHIQMDILGDWLPRTSGSQQDFENWLDVQSAIHSVISGIEQAVLKVLHDVKSEENLSVALDQIDQEILLIQNELIRSVIDQNIKQNLMLPPKASEQRIRELLSKLGQIKKWIKKDDLLKEAASLLPSNQYNEGQSCLLVKQNDGSKRENYGVLRDQSVILSVEEVPNGEREVEVDLGRQKRGCVLRFPRM